MNLSQGISFPNLGIKIEHLPDSFTLFGNVDVTIYGLFVGLAIVTGYMVTKWQAKRTGQDREIYLDFSIYALLLSMVGAHLFYVLFAKEMFSFAMIRSVKLHNGGMAFYGGLLTGFLVAVFYARWKRVSLALLLDTSCVGVLAGQIIGRWGDFFNREAFGGYTDSLFAMRVGLQDVIPSSVTDEMLAAANIGGYPGYIQVHPVFLYESAWNFCLLLFLLFMTKRKRMDGDLFLYYLVGYGLCRVILETIRTDQLYLWGTRVPISGVFAFATILVAVLTWIFLHHFLRKNQNFRPKN